MLLGFVPHLLGRDTYNFRATQGVGVRGGDGGGLVNSDMSEYMQRTIAGNLHFRKCRDAQKAPRVFL